MEPETQEGLERFLTQHFDALEHALSTHLKEFSHLHKEELDFGRSLTDDILEEFVGPVTRTTRNFLRVQDLPATTFKRWNAVTEAKDEFVEAMTRRGWWAARFIRGLARGLDALLVQQPYSYHAASRGIVIGEDRAIPAVSALVHEYTHHIQYHFAGASPTKDRWFMEGHARGVQRCLCRAYAEKNGNPAFAYNPLRSTLLDLTHGYQLVCSRAKRRLRKELLYKPLKRIEKIDSEGKHYGLGVAEFCVRELLFGEEVYAKELERAKEKSAG